MPADREAGVLRPAPAQSHEARPCQAILLPFALVTAGVATAWAGALEALAAYKWPLLGVTAALLAYGFVVAYRKPRTRCAAGPSCHEAGSNWGLKVGLWIVTAVAVAGIVFEQIEPHLK